MSHYIYGFLQIPVVKLPRPPGGHATNLESAFLTVISVTIGVCTKKTKSSRKCELRPGSPTSWLSASKEFEEEEWEIRRVDMMEVCGVETSRAGL